MKEIWKDVVGYEGMYQVSNTGLVKSLKRKNVRSERILKCPIKMNKGGIKTYRYVQLCKNGVGTVHHVHSLVVDAFLPKINGKNYTNHKDGDKLNNHISNLERCTQKENIHHAFDNGLMGFDMITEDERLKRIEEKRNKVWHKISYNDSLDISNAYNLGCFTQKEIADAYSIDQKLVHNIITGKAWYNHKFYN